jgi:diguanylate cyclase (GGDEF)-like protein
MAVPTQPDAVGGLGPVSDQALIEAVLAVQSLVSRGAAPTVIYQAVVDGALGLLRGDGGSLRFRDLDDPGWMVAVAWHTSAGQGERWRHRAPITEGLSGRVIATGEPAVLEDYQAAQTGSQLAPEGTQAIIGVPIREQNRVVGSLVVASTTAGRHWSERERALLSAYAKHVGVVVAVARASSATREALTDPLTGLANRRLLLDRLQHELVRGDRGGEPVTVLFMDLDGFKLVNDSLGHSVGDQLLVAVADRLRGAIRDHDVCARLGGDEFAVLLVGECDPDAVAGRIIDVVNRRFQIGENEVFVSISVGIVGGREEAETLLGHADVAMYHAKRSGAGNYALFEPSMQAALVSRLTVRTELRRAIERAEFELRYQPIFDLQSGKIAAFEGLIRWRHPDRGVVHALDFIPIAEQTGMIVEIGHWVLEHGCRQLAAWRRQASIALSLNVSTRELQHADYAEAVRDAIHGAFPPSALILEVTERQPLDDVPGVLETLRAVKALGVRVALDDFGTGYGTLINLSRLPIDLLKIPRPFLDAVQDERHEHEPRGLLAGTIGLGRHLGITTIGEGIEHREQLDLLVALGCELGQGYHLGRPLDAAEAGQLLDVESNHGAPMKRSPHQPCKSVPSKQIIARRNTHPG